MEAINDVSRFVTDELAKRVSDDGEILTEIISHLPPRSLSMMASFLKTCAKTEKIVAVSFNKGGDDALYQYLVDNWNSQNQQAPEGAWFELPLIITPKTLDEEFEIRREHYKKPDHLIRDFFRAIQIISANTKPEFPHLALNGIAEYLIAEADKLPKKSWRASGLYPPD